MVLVGMTGASCHAKDYIMSQFIHQLLKCLPQVRESFYASGFALPPQYLAAVEATRLRGKDEHDYQRYCDEVLFEYAALPYPWQPSVRHLLKSGERSAYLDMLAGRAESDCLSLDPNFNLFVKSESWLDLLGGFRAQKQQELERHSSALREMIGASSNTLIDGIVQIAERHGYYPKRSFKARDESLDLERHADQGALTSLRVVDLPVLKKRGYVIVQYFFNELPGKPFGLDMFVPGGHQYSEWNKTPLAVFFSFYVQCRFAANLGAAPGVAAR